MIIQNVLFPSCQTCAEESLYFRSAGSESGACIEQGVLRLSNGSTVTFDTYFNGLSIGKWQKYTEISQVELQLKLCGTVRVCLMHKTMQGHEVHTRIVHETVCEAVSGGAEEFLLPFPTDAAEGMYCFSIETMSENAVLHKAAYAAAIPDASLRDVKIGIVICTFKREEFVRKNLELLNMHFLQNQRSALWDKLEIFIVDNAGTLDADTLSGQHVHVFRNRNVGGAGGFTRGILEIQKVRAQTGITHILLTDDDIVYEPEAIFRTWALLCCISSAYTDAFIGGAMLRLDDQYIQTESGAVWNGGDLISLKKGLDLRSTESCLLNEREEPVDYNAWWYCLFPVSAAAENNLPMPFFIRCDDVEYGLRNAGQVILMNGICVWHEPFENKYASSMFYYMFRNRLITNAMYGIAQPLQEVKKQLCGYAMYEIRLYRYQNAKLLMQSMDDFLGGTAWLAAQDAEERHKRLLADGYQLRPLETLDEGAAFDPELYEQEKHAIQPRNLLHRMIANRTVNGTILPPKRKFAIVPAEGAQQISVFRTRTVLNYDEASGKGFVTQRNLQEMRACKKQLRMLCKKMNQCYEQAVRDFSENSKNLQTKEFWLGYLGLQE